MLAPTPPLLRLNSTNCPTVHLHETMGKPILIWYVELVDCWAVNVTLSLHSQGRVSAEELVMGIADAHARLFPPFPGPHPAAAWTGCWNMESLLVRVAEYHLVVI